MESQVMQILAEIRTGDIDRPDLQESLIAGP